MYRVRARYLPRSEQKFDLDYYFENHVKLALNQTDGSVNITRIEVETDEELLHQPGEKKSPCIFVVELETREDLENFRRFFDTPDVIPLMEDVPKYTNCEIEWTVAKVHRNLMQTSHE